MTPTPAASRPASPGLAPSRAEALGEARALLARAAVREPGLDAEWLLRSVLGCDRAALIAHPQAPLDPADAARYRELVERRRQGVPVQHLTGTQSFWRHELRVGPAALIPRPETEGVVEAALGLLGDARAPLVADVGTGSGCIALALAAERPGARVHAVDVSSAALGLAALNRRELGLEARVALHHGDLLAPLAGLAGRVDLVASNPPYIDPGEAAGLPVEVRDHEPHGALFAPGERLSVYRRLAPQARRVLRPGGWLVLEIGQGMREEVAALCAEAGLEVLRVEPDLQGIPRVLIARRPTP
jgi:release factor glutamine methyltransferase